MARDFDGTDDKIEFGSDATLDDFSTLTIALWIKRDVTDQFDILVHKEEDEVGGPRFSGRHTDVLDYTHGFDGDDGNWETLASVGTGMRHVAVTYDRTSTTNDPVMYLDAAVQSLNEILAPTGAAGSDAANQLTIGELRGVLDYDGRMAHLVYHNAILTAAEINRARWWGCSPGGPSTVKVWHPMWTSDLNNRGTATANGTATGTAMDNTNVPRVERMWGSMMGIGR